MGDFRIVVEGVGGHGCGRESKDGYMVLRCGRRGCPDCEAIRFVDELKRSNNVQVARVEHWPVPGAAGTTRTENPGPVDDLLTGTRLGSFSVHPGEPYQPAYPTSAGRPPESSS